MRRCVAVLALVAAGCAGTADPPQADLVRPPTPPVTAVPAVTDDDLARLHAEVRRLEAELVKANLDRLDLRRTVTRARASRDATRTTATTKPVAPKASRTGSGVERWRPLVARYSWRVDLALAVMWCESRGDPRAQNPRSSASGLFQAIRSTWGGYSGYAEAWLAPPAVQVEHAYRLWQRAGWRPWSCA